MKENLEIVLKNIEKTCMKCNRNASEVKLIAVSKTKPIEMIKEVNSLGISNFGENWVQELDDKRKELDSVKWHFIGHLQTNKVRKLLSGNVEMIHSVDSIKLAREIDKEAKKVNKIVNILIEVNVSREESKTGILENELYDLVECVKELNNIKLCGLMTVAPHVTDSEDTRKYFKRLSELKEEINGKYNLDLKELSMGMSNDYMVAIEEGATMVRVGTSIFGSR